MKKASQGGYPKAGCLSQDLPMSAAAATAFMPTAATTAMRCPAALMSTAALRSRGV